ncbi:hypothetical protein [Streptomyces sp. NBC_01217]|uniref:hypothetical protein n=1 Tax=Streptomyces sp. NBC_01217 TaxID=2903779 RepID=UPI002E14B205|nr:hypothetical protein OG507_37945 [Streptomyces sp. NBC_01217]
MGRESWHVERTGRSPWGALALVVLICLALAKNGADFSLGPPQLVTTTSVAFTGAAATDGSLRDPAAARAEGGTGSG